LGVGDFCGIDGVWVLIDDYEVRIFAHLDAADLAFGLQLPHRGGALRAPLPVSWIREVGNDVAILPTHGDPSAQVLIPLWVAMSSLLPNGTVLVPPTMFARCSNGPKPWAITPAVRSGWA